MSYDAKSDPDALLTRIKLAMLIHAEAQESDAVKMWREVRFPELVIGIILGLDYCAHLDHHPEEEAIT